MGKNPFVEDDTDEIKRANEAASEDVADGKVAPKGDPDDPIEIDISKVDEEEAAEKETQGSRQERRQNRYAEQKAAAQEAEERAQRFERERDEERTRRIAYETHLQTQQRQQAPQQEADPEGDEILRIRAERQSLHQAYQAKSPAQGSAEYSEFVKRGYELQDREDQAKYLRNQRIYSKNQQNVTVQDVAQEAHRQRLMATYSDVLGQNVAANIKQHAYAMHQALRAAGAPDAEETVAKAVEMTRKQFRIGKQAAPPPPNETARRRLSGAGPGAAGGRAEGESVVRMTRDQARMAEKMFPSMKPDKAHRHWANTVGRKMAAKGT
jgi:hypothetical protein